MSSALLTSAHSVYKYHPPPILSFHGGFEWKSGEAMLKSIEIPDCCYRREPTLVCPSGSPPRHSLYLSNLDDQKFLRFSIKYLYLYKKPVGVESLKDSLARVLEDYYPLAGRLRGSGEGEGGEEKLVVDCNGEGAVFAEASVDLTAEEFLEASRRPNSSWRKLLYRVDAQSFVGVPPLVVQVTHLSCGGMVLCTGISHCVCDGIGSSQFLHAWAQRTAKSGAGQAPVSPFHSRGMLRSRSPTAVGFPHPEFAQPLAHQLLHPQQPLSPSCLTFGAAELLQLKRRCVPSLKCTSFEALAAHVWRAWVRSLDPPPSLRVKLLFSVDVRRRVRPQLPAGFYGNGFVLGCAEAAAGELAGGAGNPRAAVELVQAAKRRLDDDYVRSMVDLLEERRERPDLSASLVISQWAKLGLEDLDFGEGKPLHMGPLASEIYCLFLPVVGDLHAFTVLVSVPEGVAKKFDYYLKDLWGNHGEQDGLMSDHGDVDTGLNI
uniref:Omega-hydroxypalmitate O-feruloyl transferase n=1 Tax=Anthurium amnicola TaxID=1678845 RepID=A0A1D1Y5M1_9ARAE